MNKTVTPTPEQIDLSKKQMDRTIPVAKKVLELIVGANLPIGDLKKDEVGSQYDVVKTSVLQVMLDADLEYQDLDLVYSLVVQPVSLILKGVEQALAISWENAETLKWGKSKREVTMKEADALLRSAPQMPVDSTKPAPVVA